MKHQTIKYIRKILSDLEKLVKVNNKLNEHQVKDNISEGFISNLSTRVKTESNNLQVHQLRHYLN